MNVGYMTMNNLRLPKKQKTEDTSTQSKGLLSRGSRPQSQEKTNNERLKCIFFYFEKINVVFLKKAHIYYCR